MRLYYVCITSVLFLATASVAQAWEVPARGTPTRAALMDAIRPTAEDLLGAPVQFVVYDLRRSGNVAFGMLHAQRPGGVEIDHASTPAVRRGEMEAWEDVTDAQVFYRRADSGWVVEHYAFGATDVWFATEPFCTQYRAVISDFC
ncbi:MAG: hypothetical protein AAFY25_03950 [Pseudomonadota bacterium]